MKELKKHASLDDQVSLLSERGLLIEDEQSVKDALFNVSYYRLSGYLHDFKQPGTDRYIDGLSWRKLKRIYDFDRKFSRIIMFALEDIEETLKTRLSYIITSNYPDDPLVYLRPYPYREYGPYLRFLYHFYKEKENNYNLPFVKHHDKSYDGFLPMWVAVELFTMGNLHALYANLIPRLQKQLAASYGTGPCQIESWIQNLTYTRNHLAHYMRVYNFNFGRTPAECRKHPKKFSSSNMVFDQIFVVSRMYSDKGEWNGYVISELSAIIDEYSEDIDLSSLGFPENWEEILRR